MWQKHGVYERFPTLTKTGKSIYKKRFVTNPSDVECWFSFAIHNDLDALQLMIHKNFNINTVDLRLCNIGILACENNKYALLKFFFENNGDLSYFHETTKETIYEMVCYPSLGTKFFQLIYNRQTLHHYNKEEFLNLLLNVIQTPLFNDDKNLNKIKHLYSCMDLSFAKELKQFALNELLADHMGIPKIIYFLKDRDSLYSNLKHSLCNHTYIKREKI